MRAVPVDDVTVVCSEYEPGCDATVADEGFTVSQPEFHQRTLMRANGGPLPSLSCDVRSLHSESAVQAWPVSLPPTVPHPHSGWLLPPFRRRVVRSFTQGHGNGGTGTYDDVNRYTSSNKGQDNGFDDKVMDLTRRRKQWQ